MLILLFFPLEQGMEVSRASFGLIAGRLDVVDVIEVEES